MSSIHQHNPIAIAMDRYALWKNFPDWRKATTTSTSSDEAVEPRTPATTSAFSSGVCLSSRVERDAHIFDSILDTRAIDGGPNNIGRLVPFLALLDRVKETCYRETEHISREEYDTFLYAQGARWNVSCSKMSRQESAVVRRVVS